MEVKQPREAISDQNEFRIFFRESTRGYHVFCYIERLPKFSWPYIGLLHQREMSAGQAMKYAEKYVMHRSKRKPQYRWIIDQSGLAEEA